MNEIINSFKKNSKGILLIFIASFLTSIGQLFWKISESKNFNFLILGFLLYGIGAILMILSFKFGSLSVLQPMLSFSYIFAIFLGSIVLKESISFSQIIATLIIIFGVILIGGGDA